MIEHAAFASKRLMWTGIAVIAVGFLLSIVAPLFFAWAQSRSSMVYDVAMILVSFVGFLGMVFHPAVGAACIALSLAVRWLAEGPGRPEVDEAAETRRADEPTGTDEPRRPALN